MISYLGDFGMNDDSITIFNGKKYVNIAICGHFCLDYPLIRIIKLIIWKLLIRGVWKQFQLISCARKPNASHQNFYSMCDRKKS